MIFVGDLRIFRQRYVLTNDAGTRSRALASDNRPILEGRRTVVKQNVITVSISQLQVDLLTSA